MASAYSPRWRRILHEVLPFLFKTCPGGNRHWFWDTICYCMINERCGDKGGAYLFKTKAWFLLRDDMDRRCKFCWTKYVQKVDRE